MKKLMSIEKSDYVNKKHIDKCDYANYNVRIATNKRRRKRGKEDGKIIKKTNSILRSWKKRAEYC